VEFGVVVLEFELGGVAGEFYGVGAFGVVFYLDVGEFLGGGVLR